MPVSLTNPVFSMSADNLLTTLPTLQGRDINVHEKRISSM